LFKADGIKKIGMLALKSMDEYGRDVAEFSRALQLESAENLVRRVYERVRAKLTNEPVEDYRIDFEDGYGIRSDEEEDTHAKQAATEVARAMASNSLPPFFGFRVKSLSERGKRRSLRTLDLFLSCLLSETKTQVPANFVVTLPKVTTGEQVSVLVEAISEVEQRSKLAKGSIGIELMVEEPASLIDRQGSCPLSRLVEAAGGRCTALHLGAYDLTAAMDIVASQQSLMHPYCDFARTMMKVAMAGTTVRLCDGATNVLPVPVHKAQNGEPLSPDHIAENRRSVHHAWRLSYRHIRHALMNGYYQGWDLHPAQLPVRYAAAYTFFLENIDQMSSRFKAFVAKAGGPSLVRDTFDDAASGRGLINFFLRALRCGAISEQEFKDSTGMSVPEAEACSF
jgi:citrate lyase beta subunit